MQRDFQRPFARPADATEVLLVRHGAIHRLPGDTAPTLPTGHSDFPLAPLGQEQARTLATRLARVPIDALFVSPMARTSQTAAPVVESRGLRPKVLPELRDVFLGEWERGVFAQ